MIQQNKSKDSGSHWDEVSTEQPCLMCAKTDWCTFNTRIDKGICRRKLGKNPKTDKSGQPYQVFRFQGLAADGAKVSLYRLVKAGYRVVNFIHDEFLIEIPLGSDLESVGKDVEELVVRAMRALVPDVLIKAEWAFSDRWYKQSELVRDESGKVQIYSKKLDKDCPHCLDLTDSFYVPSLGAPYNKVLFCSECSGIKEKSVMFEDQAPSQTPLLVQFASGERKVLDEKYVDSVIERAWWADLPSRELFCYGQVNRGGTLRTFWEDPISKEERLICQLTRDQKSSG